MTERAQIPRLPDGELAQSKSNKFSGYTEDQVLQLLEQIATNANTVASICRAESMNAGTSDLADTLNSLQCMAEVIGALADAPTGGQCVGSFTDWFCGPHFNRYGARAMPKGMHKGLKLGES